MKGENLHHNVTMHILSFGHHHAWGVGLQLLCKIQVERGFQDEPLHLLLLAFNIDLVEE